MSKHKDGMHTVSLCENQMDQYFPCSGASRTASSSVTPPLLIVDPELCLARDGLVLPEWFTKRLQS